MFFRSCAECRKYILINGKPAVDVDGNKKLRPENLPVVCDSCKKYDVSTKTAWEKFTPKNEYVFLCYRAAVSFGALPKAGGINDQDAEMMQSMLLVHEIVSRSKEIENKDWMLKLAKIGH